MYQTVFQKQYITAVAEKYREDVEFVNKTSEVKKGRSYKNLFSLLEEGFFLGATKFGDNFIA